MSAEPKAVDEFLQTWVEEFTRAVEMFTGQVPTLRCSRTQKLASGELDGFSWWKQQFVGDGRFVVWVGAKNDTVLALTASTDMSEAQPTYLEMVGQAQSGAAHVCSAGFDTPVKCEAGEDSSAPDHESLLYGLVGVTVEGNELPALVFAIEPSIETILNPEEPAPAAPVSVPNPGTELLVAPSNQPMLNRLMELELPLSIALGRASLPIREVLKVTSGSVIELEKNVGDFVELLVHGTIVARGEVVSVKGNYGVRIKEIISQQDRMHLYRR